MDTRLLERIRSDTQGARYLVDLGCGPGEFIRQLPHVGTRVGVDLVQAPIVAARNPLLDGWLFFRADMREFDLEGYDAVLLVDSLEHVTKIQGLDLLRRAQETAGTVIVFTPEGFWPQPAADDNPHQQHQAGWSSDDLEELDFDVERVTGIGEAPVSLYAVWRAQ